MDHDVPEQSFGPASVNSGAEANSYHDQEVSMAIVSQLAGGAKS